MIYSTTMHVWVKSWAELKSPSGFLKYPWRSNRDGLILYSPLQSFITNLGIFRSASKKLELLFRIIKILLFISLNSFFIFQLCAQEFKEILRKQEEITGLFTKWSNRKKEFYIWIKKLELFYCLWNRIELYNLSLRTIHLNLFSILKLLKK